MPTDTNRAYQEFSEFYTRERCCWSPGNPRRAFCLAVRRLYQPYFRERMSPWQFMACVYDVLGVRRGDPRGLFQDFDPARYHGKLPLERHFLNLFMKRLRMRLRRSVRPRTDMARADREGRFGEDRRLGLFVERRRLRRKTVRIEDVADREWPPRDLGRLVDTVGEALSTLEEPERMIIELTYWPRRRPSAREIGRALGCDHKTVRNRHDAALVKLRVYYGEEEKLGKTG